METATQRASEKSTAIMKSAKNLMPHAGAETVGANGTARKQPDNPVLAKGKGGIVTDVDGNEYIDYACVGGAQILGHADERVIAAIGKTTAKGCGFGGITEIEVRLAELICSRLPYVDMVRFVATPENALAGACEAACIATRRKRIVAFEGTPRIALSGTPGDLAQMAPHAHAPGNARLPFNDAAALERLLQAHRAAVAGVLLAPVVTSRGVITPAPGFLEQVGSICDKHETLLIFDESSTAFRLSPSGAVGLYGVEPDLTVLGCVIGGGLPLAAFGGRRSIMESLGQPHSARSPGGAESNKSVMDDAEFPVTAASHDVVAMSAGVATLQALGEEGFYDDLEARSARLDEELRAAASTVGVRVYQHRVASVFSFYLLNGGEQLGSAIPPVDAGRFRRYREALLDRGVYVPADPYACLFVSAAHTDDDISQTIAAVTDALRFAAS